MGASVNIAADCPECNRPFAHPCSTCPRWAEHDRAGFDDWTTYERTQGRAFAAWLTDPWCGTNGARYRYAAIQEYRGSGLNWVLLVYVLPLPGECPKEIRRSGGCFYDGTEEHPEGAIEWARWGAAAYQRGQDAAAGGFDARVAARVAASQA